MKCPECENAGLQSETWAAMLGPWTEVGWMPFTDAAGRTHRHDPNIQWIEWRCGNGHSFGECRQSRCPVEGCSFNEGKS